MNDYKRSLPSNPWLNFFIPNCYISGTLGPGGIMCGGTYDYKILCRKESQFGEYVQTNKKTTNIMKLYAVNAITLRPSCNK